MTTLHRLPASFALLPDIPFLLLSKLLSVREWSTYAVGIRSRDPLRKPEQLKAVRARFASHELFAGKRPALDFPDVEIILDEVEQAIVVQVTPLILTGRYTKLVRNIAQTLHYCFVCKGKGCGNCHQTGLLTPDSVQQSLTPFFVDAFGCAEILFHGAGREDVDVRMLGNGRPFALTLENPAKRSVDVKALETQINSTLQNKVQISNLQIGRPDDVAYITQKYHTKRYRALVHTPQKFNPLQLTTYLNQKTDLSQTTPIRVEQRRVMKERLHWITLEKLNEIDSNHVEIFVHASAGCYIKEFISGDEGRTKPSFADWAKVSCVCKELDVLEIVDDEVGSFTVA